MESLPLTVPQNYKAYESIASKYLHQNTHTQNHIVNDPKLACCLVMCLEDAVFHICGSADHATRKFAAEFAFILLDDKDREAFNNCSYVWDMIMFEESSEQGDEKIWITQEDVAFASQLAIALRTCELFKKYKSELSYLGNELPIKFQDLENICSKKGGFKAVAASVGVQIFQS